MIKALTLAATALALSGCATVSMVSKEAVVETGAAAETSELTKSARAFTKTAEAKGWSGEQRGLMDFASALFSSGPEDGARKASNYAERISASDADVAQVFETVEADAIAAAKAFAGVQALAQDALNNDSVAREDLISFETALVTAQKSHRGFAEATGIAAGRATDAPELEAAEAALSAFATEIDAASETADALADAYAEASASSTAAS